MLSANRPHVFPTFPTTGSNMSTEDVDDEVMTAEDSADDLQLSLDSATTICDEPVSLEGILSCRKGRSSGRTSLLWTKRFVFLNLSDGGSISVYKEPPTGAAASPIYEKHHQPSPSKHSEAATTTSNSASISASSAAVLPPKVYSRLHRRVSSSVVGDDAKNLELCIPAELPWIAKDMENDSSSFVIEIPSEIEEQDEVIVNNKDDDGGSVSISSVDFRVTDHQASDLDERGNQSDGESLLDDNPDHANGDNFPVDDFQSFLGHSKSVSKELLREIDMARRKGKPYRIYFRCTKGDVEKGLWLKAFSRLNRLSSELRKKRTFFHALAHLSTKETPENRSRTRSASNADFARDARQLDLNESAMTDEDNMSRKSNHPIDPDYGTRDVEALVRGPSSRFTRDKEFRVLPQYTYPHRWLTKMEMKEEMLLPSEHFHDLRVPGCPQKEVGNVRVEVLQCLGLPKLDRTSDTDAVVYLVCGSYAFATDVIPNRANPMWLRKSRRACIFPLFHGYARLYVGVFDDDPKRVKDEFAGRVVVDLARLRPRSTYDVTLPLRLSTSVYSRRRRGAIRLRLTLTWTSERDALLSYLPRRIKIPPPQKSKPNFETSVLCSDEKSFRNIAITVHGAHMPGRFTFQQMRAATREIGFTRKHVISAVKQNVRELMIWVHPALSVYVFSAWMYCVYLNSFSRVPAFVVTYFLLLLMRNYAKYGIDSAWQRGFIPPSWEEMFMALLYGSDPNYQAIEPLDLGIRPASLGARLRSTESLSDASIDWQQNDYRVQTHKPKGKLLFRALGFLPEKKKEFLTVEEDHLEFPFATGIDYPRFTVKEALVSRKGDAAPMNISDNRSTDGSASVQNSADKPQSENRLMRIPLEMEFPDIMRKDSSGLRDDDEEENNFAPRHAIKAKGLQAAETISSAATELTELTGLNYVVTPIKSGIASGMNQIMLPTSGFQSYLKRSATQEPKPKPKPVVRSLGLPKSRSVAVTEIVAVNPLPQGAEEKITEGDDVEVDPALVFPEQNIDIEGPSKKNHKVTDDLAEIKDRMHELTWNLFYDHAYVVKNPNALYFGEGKKSGKRRKTDVNKQFDKLLHIGQYSHSNPFVARVGLYVEPIIGSAYSFLCVFRAAFNVFTWRDPMLTFWVSLFTSVLALILFFFPWRIFMFVLGVYLVGPQNMVIRILRERGHLPSPRKKESDSDENMQPARNWDELPTDQPVFSRQWREPGNDQKYPVDPTLDPREIHHVVVPNSRLIYHRFYDWPPEPQYALVRPESQPGASENQRLKQDSPTSPARRPQSFGSWIAARTDQARFRQRSHRRNLSSDALPPVAPRRRAVTADWVNHHSKSS